MAGVMSSTIGELLIIQARTTRLLIDYISQVSIFRPSTSHILQAGHYNWQF